MNFTQKETELRSKMEPIIVKAQAGTASTEEVTQLKAMTDELTSLKAQMEAAVAAEKAQADLAAGKGVNTVDTTAKVETALLSGKGMTFDDKPEMTEKQARIYGSDEHLKAFANFFKAKGNLNNLDQETLKVVNEMIDTEGGFYVPPQHVNQVIERKVAPSRLANLVTNFQAASNQVRYPTVRYTTDDLYASGMRPILTGEQPATATTANVTEPVWGETVINIHTYMATLPVSNDFLEDTVNFGSWITKSLMDMADVNIDSQIANGVGGNQGPLGLVTAAGIAVAAGGIATVNTSVDNSFDWNDLVGVTMELPEQYAANGTFVMNRVSAGRTALTLEGADGQPIFRRGGFNNGITEAQPDTLNGYPIAYSAHMPNLANAAVPVIFGDLSQYVLARRGVMTIKVQQEVNYTLNRTLFTLRYRIGGAPVQPAAFRALLCI